MTPSSTSTTKSKAKAEKVCHPQSRKAGQFERAQLRKLKLSSLARKKSKTESLKIDKFVFFYHAIPPAAPAMSLTELHKLISDVWLKRHDIELEAEMSARRKGRPKSAKQMILEETVLREREEYRTGFEVPDLTHAPTVAVFRRWGQTGIGYLDLLRYIRISSDNPKGYIVSRPGKHKSIAQARDVEMEDSPESDSLEDNICQASELKFASTMQTMGDGPPALAVVNE